MGPAPSLPQVRLKTDELPRGPWIYARQVETPEEVADGELVEVADLSGRFVGHALYNSASDIRLRWLSRGRRTDLERPERFLEAKLRAADDLRRRTLRLEETTDAYRLVHAEGDDLSGLVVDRLGEALVCEYHALGFFRWRAEIARVLGRIHPGFAIHHRVPPAAARSERIDARELDPTSETDEVWIHENGLAFPVAPAGGHKTGWFCDQRENRVAIGALASGRTVLDLCCNTGGFALHAARAGARSVRGVDLDEKALERARRAATANELDVDFVHEDAFDHLRALNAGGESARAELVVLDPHKLAPTRADLEAGKRKYLDLNALALGAVRPGGLLATFSCSGALELEGFLGIVFAAARRAGRELRLLSILEAGPDHPQRPDWPRSRYLKGALVALDR